jgi:N-methylhydantoinase B
MRSEKILVRTDGTRERLPSKCDEVQVGPGDMLIYRTAGGGGWKDPFDRPAALVEADVAKGLVSREKAARDYGMVVGDPAATERLRARLRAERGPIKDFDFGPALDEILAQAREQTGLEPPIPQAPLPWAPMEVPDAALRRARAQDARRLAEVE